MNAIRSTLCAVMACALPAMISCKDKKHEGDAGQAPFNVEVADVVVDSVTLYKTYPGTLTADNTVQVVARVNGRVSGPTFKGGDYVTKGQVLFTIDSNNYNIAFNSAKANLEKAKADNAYAEQHYQAVSRAYDKNAVSQMELAQALSNRDQSRAAIEGAKAALNDAALNVEYCTVKAPISGYITSNAYSGGTFVTGENSPVTLATIYDDSKVIAHFTLEDDSFLRMFENPNNRHLVDYSAIPVDFQETLPHTYTADLTYMAPNVNASTGTMALEAHIANPYHELRSGMYCTVKMPYKVDPKGILVRDASISTDQLGKYVYLVNDSNKIVYTPIEVGDMVGDTMRLVTKGLTPQDRYVTSAMLKVRDGMSVNPVSSTSK